MIKRVKVKSDRTIKQKCPVCRNRRYLTLHHILPQFIFREVVGIDRASFLNGRNSYWLCAKCHTKYESESTKLRNQMLSELNFPEGSENRYVKQKQLVKIKSLCRYMAGKFPKTQYGYSIYESYNFVKEFYNEKYIIYDKIIQYANMKDTTPNPDYINLGQFLLEKIGLKELDYIYRKDLLNFLNRRDIHEYNLIPERNKKYNEIRLTNITEIC